MNISSTNNNGKQSIFSLLKFNDVNGNGIIEKGLKEEGYSPTADIDGDGNIGEAEAKVYLLKNDKVPTEVKAQYQLSDAEKYLIKAKYNIQIPRMLEEIKKNESREQYPLTHIRISEYARDLAKLGFLDRSVVLSLFNKALDFIPVSENIILSRMGVVIDVVHNMIDAKYYEEAADALSLNPYPGKNTYVYCDIADAMEKDNVDPQRIFKIYDKAIDSIASLSPQEQDDEDPIGQFGSGIIDFMVKIKRYDRAIDLINMCEKEKTGRNINSELYNLAKRILEAGDTEGAIQIIAKVKDSKSKSLFCKEIVVAMVKENKLDEAYTFAGTISGLYSRATAKAMIAGKMYSSGKDTDRAIEIFKESASDHSMITDTGYSAQARTEIRSEMKKAGIKQADIDLILPNSK